MGERVQFLWGAGCVALWLISVLFVIGYSSDATSLFIPYTYRDAEWGDGYKYLSDAWKAGVVTPQQMSTGLSLLGCQGTSTAPICGCLYALRNTSCSAKMVQCFLLTRQVQQIEVQGQGMRPYMVLLMVNTWTALVGVVLLVRGKLADKNSYSVQLFVQFIVMAVTLGAMWLVFKSPLVEWLVTFLVALVLIVAGWYFEDEDWCALNFSLMYFATLPGLAALYGAYNHRNDLLYLSVQMAFTITLALLVAARTAFDRIQGFNTTWLTIAQVVLSLALLAFTYDETSVMLLKSATYAWIVYTIYLFMGMGHNSGVEKMLLMELILRAVLSVAMIVELF